MLTTVITFYHFADLPDFAEWRAPLKTLMKQESLRGILLLAPEGINATLSGSPEGLEALLTHIKADPRFATLFVKESHTAEQPFRFARVRLKKEIITMGLPANVPARTGKHLTAREWDALLDDPDLLLLDTRNDYETHLGSFQRAEKWPLQHFNHFPKKVEQSIDKKQKIAMFCTGGVRCEKLSSWMLEQGYEKIYQLDGGIIHYLNSTPEGQGKWRGECYVFDDRVAVGHASRPSESASLCPGCGHSLTPEDRRHPAWLPAYRCAYC